MSIKKDESPQRIRKRFEVIEKVHLYGPMERRNEAIDALIDKDYIITQSGPKLKGSFKYDTSQFYIVAERVVEPGTTIWGNKNEDII